MRKFLIILAVLLVAGTILVWRIPANWVLEMAQPRLPDMSWAQSQGSAWHGRITDLSRNGLQLGTLEWRFDGFENLAEKLTRWTIHSHGSQHDISALVTVSPDGGITRLAEVRGHLPAAWVDLSKHFPLLYLDGLLQLDLDHLDLEERFPVNGAGRILWSGAAVTGGANESFGDLELNFSPRSDKANEGVDFSIRTLDEADISIRGDGNAYRNDYTISLALQIAPHRKDLLDFMGPLGGEVSTGAYQYSWRGSVRW